MQKELDMSYSYRTREAVLKRLTESDYPNPCAVAEEFDIHFSTIYRWIKGTELSLGVEAVKKNKKQQVSKKEKDRKTQKGPVRQQDWTLEQRLQVVLETNNLSEEELGAYCRTRGIYATVLPIWRDECLKAIQGPRRKPDPDKVLKKELLKAQKELHEARVLLDVQKKLQGLLNTGEDGEGGT